MKNDQLFQLSGLAAEHGELENPLTDQTLGKDMLKICASENTIGCTAIRLYGVAAIRLYGLCG